MSTAKLFNSGRDAPRFRIKMAVAFVAVVALACVIAAALLLWRAGEERGALRQQALRRPVALSRALDQEVAAMNYLLKGLSTSPALRTGDLKAFYDQLMATPVPEGSWLILHDLEGQVLNTLRPFGAALPRHSDFRTSPVQRVREVGWAVSGRTASLLRPGASIVGLSLRVDSDGRAHEALSHGNCLGSSAQGDHDGTRASPCHTHRCVRPRPAAPFCARAGEPPVAPNRGANAAEIALPAPHGGELWRACSSASTNRATRFSSGCRALPRRIGRR